MMRFYIYSTRNILWLFLMVTTLCSGVLGQRCEQSSYNKFASKTAYRLLGNADKRPIMYAGCRPAQIYFIARHGTRYPGASDVQDMMLRVPKLRDTIVQNADSLKSQLCTEDVESLKKWRLNFNGSSTNLLHQEGHLELNEIADTLKSQFPSLFNKPYSPSIYKFRTTKSQRTEESAEAFANGLFNTHRGVNYDVMENNDLLRFYKTCSRWEKEVDDNETAHMEYFTFIRGPEMNNVLESVSQRLGMNDTLTFANVSILYEMCRFDTAWVHPTKSTTSPWCKVFSDVDLQILEYAEDLQYYWKEGYGFPLNYEQACPVLKDVIETFREVTTRRDHSSDQQPVGLFHFTHSGMLLKFYARLGLFHDQEPLLSTNYHRQTNRKWKTSEIDPFAGNIAFVLYNCSTGVEADYKVATYVQHKEVILHNCTTVLCPLDTFVETYGSFADNCDLPKLCSSNDSSSLVLSFTIVFFTFGIYAVRILIA